MDLTHTDLGTSLHAALQQADADALRARWWAYMEKHQRTMPTTPTFQEWFEKHGADNEPAPKKEAY